MQGYILNYNRSREEDLIVTILTRNEIKTLYRFYGARHSVINIGYKLDFEEDIGIKVSINRLKETIHLGYDWLRDNNKLYHYQEFIKLLNRHLKDIVEIEPFYIDLLDDISIKLSHQSPKRLLIESYLKLLEYEGRLYVDFTCLICENKIDTQDVVLLRAFSHAHFDCVNKYKFNTQKIQNLFKSKNSFELDDSDIDKIWYVLLEGL
jgi:recombinational DNA repair protein (RecF pathway)